MLFRKAKVRTQEIGHRTVAEPLPMQPPFAARSDQPVAGENLQNLIPPRPLAARRQAIGPEPIEFQLLPQLPGQPARAPLPRALKPHHGIKNPVDNRRHRVNSWCRQVGNSSCRLTQAAVPRVSPASVSGRKFPQSLVQLGAFADVWELIACSHELASLFGRIGNSAATPCGGWPPVAPSMSDFK